MTPNYWFSCGLVATLATAGCGTDSNLRSGERGSGATSGASGSGTSGNVNGGSNATGGSSGGTQAGGAAGTSTSGTGGSTGGTGAGGTETGGTGTGGEGGTGTPTTCTITASAELSSAIQTVGIVTLTTDLAGVSGGHIDFGLDTSYGLSAPLELAETNYRTLLLGMKQSRQYHYRVVLASGTMECTGPDQTIMTGTLPNILPTVDVNTIDRAKLFGGFVMTGQYQAQGGPRSPAYILDADGDFVWAIAIGDYVTGVRQSYDGKYMWINGSDNMNTGGTIAHIHRVTMDGLNDNDLSQAFGIQDHQITILPDESVIFYGHDQECPDIKRRYADGRIETIINARTAHGATGPCHVNHVEYSPDDQTIIFSDDNHDNYTKVTLDGRVVWVLGGMTNDFTGDGANWDRQHGVDVLAVNRLLYFNNGPMTGGSGSQVHELVLDLSAMTATRAWTYTAMPPIRNIQLGDVQRLANGNTVVAYSTQGVLQEIDAQMNVLQEIVWPLGGAFGYIHKRASLYGPPPR